MVQRYLEQHDGDGDEEDEEQQQGDYPTVVICSGELLEQVSHKWRLVEFHVSHERSDITPSQLC